MADVMVTFGELGCYRLVLLLSFRFSGDVRRSLVCAGIVDQIWLKLCY